jgi:hypothetical protein
MTIKADIARPIRTRRPPPSRDLGDEDNRIAGRKGLRDMKRFTSTLVYCAFFFTGLSTGCGGDDHSKIKSDAAIDSGEQESGVELCGSDSECSDGKFCNGVERCNPGAKGADERSCVVPSKGPCDDGESCNDRTKKCIACSENADVDGDNHDAVNCGGDDCDDNDPNRYPGNIEVCDNKIHDEDCDPTTFGNKNDDGDGEIDAKCCNVAADRKKYCGTDCDDARIDVRSKQLEICDGIDNNCDGKTDEKENAVDWYKDNDGDGFGGKSVAEKSCQPVSGASLLSTDCDDSHASRHPGATELCDSIDNNCDGETDNSELCASCGEVDEVRACICARQVLGIHTCSADGSWTACSCEGSPSIDAGTSNANASNDGSGGAGGAAGTAGTTEGAGGAGGIGVIGGAVQIFSCKDGTLYIDDLPFNHCSQCKVACDADGYAITETNLSGQTDYEYTWIYCGEQVAEMTYKKTSTNPTGTTPCKKTYNCKNAGAYVHSIVPMNGPTVNCEAGDIDRTTADASVSGAGGGGSGGAGGTGGTGVTCVTAVATGSPGLIDDLEDGDTAIYQNDGRNGGWYIINDGTGTQTPSSSSSIPSSGQACTSGSGFASWGALIGLSLNSIKAGDTYKSCYYDATEYAGIIFKVSGTVRNGYLRFVIETSETTSVDYGGKCPTTSWCGDDFGVNLSVTSNSQTIEANFSDLQQFGFGAPAVWNKKQLTGLKWIVKPYEGGAPADFTNLCIDDVEFF